MNFFLGLVLLCPLEIFEEELPKLVGVAGIDAKGLFARLDSDRDGLVSYSEFKIGLLSLTNSIGKSHSRRGALRGGQMDAVLAVVEGPPNVYVQWDVLSKVAVSLQETLVVKDIVVVPGQNRTFLLSPAVGQTLQHISVGHAATIDRRAAPVLELRFLSEG